MKDAFLGIAHAWHQMGKIHRYMGDFTAAEACLEKALEMRKQYGSLVFLGDVMMQPGSDESSNYLDPLPKVVHLIPQLCCTKDDSEESQFSGIIRLRATSPCKMYVDSLVADSLHELGIVSLKSQRVKKAQITLEQALLIKSEHKKFHDNEMLVSDIAPKIENSSRVEGGSMASVVSKIRYCYRSGSSRFSFLRLRCAETGEASTLHQLGIVSTVNRDYEDAEKKLELSLERLEEEEQALGMPSYHVANDEAHTGQGERERVHVFGSSGVSVAAKAATLQQIGRLALRKGNPRVAESRLKEALSLYERTYGLRRCESHINVAAVRHQLGASYMVSQRYVDAREQFALALKAREALHLNEPSIGGDGSGVMPCDHFEVAHELIALAQAEFECGGVQSAKSLFSRSKAMLDRLLKALLTVNPHTKIAPEDHPLGERRLSKWEALQKQSDKLSHSFTLCLYFLSKIARIDGDVALASSLSKQAALVKKNTKSALLEHQLAMPGSASNVIHAGQIATSTCVGKTSRVGKAVDALMDIALCDRQLVRKCITRDLKKKPKDSVMSTLDEMHKTYQVINDITTSEIDIPGIFEGRLPIPQSYFSSLFPSEKPSHWQVLQSKITKIDVGSLFLSENEVFGADEIAYCHSLVHTLSIFYGELSKATREGKSAEELLDICDTLRASLRAHGSVVKD